jgi:hypothetical protein
MKIIFIGMLLLFVSLGVGMVGFNHYLNVSWTDSFLNASMILTGMGPIHECETDSGKIFAGIYALYSGIIFLSIVGIMLIPIFHKYIQKLNIENQSTIK